MAMVTLYGGCRWADTVPPLFRELDMIRMGGKFRHPTRKDAQGKRCWCGNGNEWHFKRAMELCWPDIKMHRWLELFIDNYFNHRTIAVLGPASSGKTFSASVCVLLEYYCFPRDTTVMVCSTTIPMLEQRIWGEIKKLHRKAKELHPQLHGHLIESKLRIVTDDRDQASEGRDFRNGIVGIPTSKKGGDSMNIGDFVGAKNARVRLVGDELMLLPPGFVTSISNLDKNKDFKAIGLGNPKDTTDALGVMSEPSAAIGGWESNIDQEPITKTWPTRRAQGVCIQYVGTDSPNLDGKLGIPIITQEDIDRDVSQYGRDSLNFTMMNQGMMPRGFGSHRVITRQMCQKFRAIDPPVWAGTGRVRIASLDAAYRASGGDRCVLNFGEFGEQAEPVPEKEDTAQAIIMQAAGTVKRDTIIALTETVIVPIKGGATGGKFESPEDQIATFVKDACEARGVVPENFFYDSGMRTELVTSFARLWSPQVNPVDCGGRPSENKVSADLDVLARDYYFNRITEIWYSVRYIIEAGQMRGLTEEAMNEGCAREWKKVAGNKIQVEPKSDMKRKTGRSPDLFDALALMCLGAVQRGFRIKRIGSMAPKREVDESWKEDLREKRRELMKQHQLNYSA